jgi:Lon protease-like protein
MAAFPMFPLGSVLFPSLVLPLHVFEPRYRQLVQDCIAAPEPEFGVVLIERGSEVGGGDQRSSVGTVARILEVAETEDGRYAIGAVGVRRLRVVQWLEDDPYPRAEVTDWKDVEPAAEITERQRALEAVLRRALALQAELGEAPAKMTVELADDPVLAGYQAAALGPFGPLDKQRLLAATSPDERLDMLERLLAEEVDVLDRRLAAG